MQILLAKTNYTDLSDPSMIETDMFGITSKIFEKILYQPVIMNLISANQNTGEPMPAEMLQRLKDGKLKV